MKYKSQLIKLLTNKKAVIGIIGLGYIGLPILLRFADLGFHTIGFDINQEKLNKLKKQYDCTQITNTKNCAKPGKIEITDDIKRFSEADAIIICVPTPLNKYREPDLSYIIDATTNLLPVLRKGQVISLESTTYPGTTDEELKPRIEAAGFKIGEDIFLIYSPERIDPGNPKYEFADIPKICGGITPHCTEVGEILYKNAVCRVIKVSSTRAAEMTKLLENIHRAVNIGLINELKIIADKMDINIFEVINAAATKPFGFIPYYPGPGLGGHCIPVDPFYLTWKAREFGIHTHFIELAGEINNKMPEWVVNKTISAMNQNNTVIKNAHILILGLSYKKNIDDIRESPAIDIIKLLLDKKAKVAYSDPFVPQFYLPRHNLRLTHQHLTHDTIKDYDCVILVTDHNEFDFQLIKDNAKILVDTRGVFHEIQAEHIIHA
jgi:UDP-N-acetyl-D-glucosamine dehydrogenase